MFNLETWKVELSALVKTWLLVLFAFAKEKKKKNI